MGPQSKLSDSQAIEAVLRYRAGEDAVRIANDFGVHPVTARRVLRREGVSLRGKREAALIQHDSPIQSITRAQWMALYWSEGSGYPSLVDLSRAIGIDKYSIRLALIALQIPIRPQSSSAHRRRGVCFKIIGQDAEEAVRRWIGGESADAIGRDYGSSGDTVLNRVRQRSGDVPLRRLRVKAPKRPALRQLYPRAQSFGTPATRPSTAVDLAWAAGFLEAEGYFGTRKHCLITVHQTNREPLDRLQAVFGGRVRDGHRRYDENPRWSHQWYGTVGSVRARGIAMTVYPLLSARRQRRIMEMMGRLDG